MKKVLAGLSPTSKFMAKLNGIWIVTTGHDKPRYVDAKTLRSGYAGMHPWTEDVYKPSGVLVSLVYVSGDITPDVVGYFIEAGTHNGETYYKLQDQDWYLWWDGSTDWIVSEAVGTTGARYWNFTDAAAYGEYGNQGTATGNLSVSDNRSVSIAGSPLPNITGEFIVSGHYNDELSYTSENGLWHLWWDNIDTWFISSAKGTASGVYWEREDPDKEGAYTEQGDADSGCSVVLKDLGLGIYKYYSLKVEAVDTRFASTTGMYRLSIPTIYSDPIRPTGKGQGILWTLPVHPQQGTYDLGVTEDSEATERRLYLGESSTEAVMEGATFLRAKTIEDNTTTSWIMVDNTVSTSQPNDNALPPPYAKLCIASYNRLWLAGGVSEIRGKVTPRAPVHPETRYSLEGNTSGADQTYFREGHERATITIPEDRSYLIDEVDETNQILYLTKDFEGTLDVGTTFKLVSNYGLYWSGIDNPHYYPLANYVPIEGYVTALWAAGRSIFVATKDAIHRFAAQAPEQGWIRLPQKVGCPSPHSIVTFNDVSYFFDGVGFSGCDEVSVANFSNYKIRELLQNVDPDYIHMITGAVDKLTNTIFWHFPVKEGRGNNYGVEFHPDSGDMYPIWRPDVQAIWEENGKVHYGTSGYFSESRTSAIWELDYDAALDGVGPAQAIQGTVKSVVGRVVTLDLEPGSLPTEFAGLPLTIRTSETEDEYFICGDGTNGEVLESFAGTALTTFAAGMLLTLESTFASQEVSIWLHSDYDLTNIKEGDSAWYGVIPFSFGPKWLDFGSPRYRHRVYELDLGFLPILGPLTLVVDWYADLGATPVKTQEYSLAEGDTKIQVPFRYQPVYTVGFKIRVYGKYRIQIMHYNVTWATLR